ncbi:cobyrinic acid a,c-diamide synthase [Methylophilus rhizosphaerae]|uniref:Cobyrinic acid a,c-diamide synthase n=1 Tax=Methylophilus rhizosphaerae TaxID=492660 RepID=A0A1G9DVU1_9PROT|nr:cobyrinate a,c-diamide synthase [Methylophilus rhizosphaerae]SDK67978.1 cobyrinic acid a,c-diamide synthase [Methylophilus rhizosphaerae]
MQSTASCHAMLMAAPASGQGKTMTTAALARAYHNRGLRVQTFKCGPDFIDGMILEVAIGKPVYNLDLGMCGEADAQRLLYDAAQHNDVILIEGVMGLYDGTPSCADIAERFGIPVALVINAKAMAQTFAAIAYGLYAYRPALQRAGVIANQVGSEGHANMIKAALPADVPWLGVMKHDTQLSLPERHLGLHLAQEIDDIDQRIEAAAQLLGQDTLLPPTVHFSAPAQQTIAPLLQGKTIAVAKDAAFCFTYQANLDLLQRLGANIQFFSPLHDTQLPAADAYWLPGGYPELHIDQLQHNHSMHDALHAAAQAGKPILAECGGMLALGETLNGQPVFGLLPGSAEIQPKLQGLGTQHASFATAGDDKASIGAHTFHYGRFETDLPVIAQGKGKYGAGEAVYRHQNITASFLHFYFPSNPTVAAQFFLP